MTAFRKKFYIDFFKYYNNFGFTLIELLVVTAIIFIMVSISFAGYTKFNRQQQINIAYEDLRNNLADAKSSAISQAISDNCRTPVSGNPNRVFNGYQVRFISNTNYVIEEKCTQGAAAIPNITNVKKEVDLYPKGLTVSISPASPDYIRFKPLLGGAGVNITITLSNGTPSQNKIITVTNEGNIQ